MRNVVKLLAFLLLVVGAGFGLGSVGVSPLIGAALGIVAVGGAAITRVSTDRLLWLSTCLFVVTVTWTGIRLGGAGGAFGNIFLVMAFLSLAAHVLMSRHELALPPWLMLAGLGLLFAQVLSLVFPPAGSLQARVSIELRTLYPTPPYLPQRSDLAAVIKFEVALIIVPALLMAAGTTRYRCARLLDLFAVSVLVSAVVGILAVGGINLSPTPFTDNRSAGLTLHPNYLGVGCTIAVPIVMLWLARAELRWRLAGCVAVPIMLGGVAASGSRAGAVTVMTGVLLTAIAIPRLRHQLRIVLPLVGTIAVGVLAWTAVGHTILSQLRLTSESRVSGSNYARKYAADLALDQIRARPTSGVGFSVIADAHNIYLEILAAGGIIALVSFAVFMGGLAASSRRGLRGPQREETIVASLGVGLWLLCGVVGNELADKFLYVVPGILMALARLRMPAPEVVPIVAGGPPGTEARAARRPAPAVAPPRVPVGV